MDVFKPHVLANEPTHGDQVRPHGVGQVEIVLACGGMRGDGGKDVACQEDGADQIIEHFNV
jgi:hypothetical protein